MPLYSNKCDVFRVQVLQDRGWHTALLLPQGETEVTLKQMTSEDRQLENTKTTERKIEARRPGEDLLPE